VVRSRAQAGMQIHASILTAFRDVKCCVDMPCDVAGRSQKDLRHARLMY
jgi:hypothetical protein